MTTKTLLFQGSEATIHKDVKDGKYVVLKTRVKKTYRHPLLEKRLVKSRIKNEVKCIEKAVEIGVSAPKILDYDYELGLITMEFIGGVTLKEFLENSESTDEAQSQRKVVIEGLGRSIAKLHSAGITHGDLTTSNIMVSGNLCVYIIDFGLSKLNSSIEEKSVDLRVFERTIGSTHSKYIYLWEIFLNSYLESIEDNKIRDLVKTRLSKVLLRGRKKRKLNTT